MLGFGSSPARIVAKGPPDAGGISPVCAQNPRSHRAKPGQTASALIKWVASRDKRLPYQNRNYIPVSSHLFKTLRDKLADTPAVGKEYEAVFDRFGYILGLINEDPRDQLPENVYTPSPPVGDVTTNWYSTSGPPLCERIKTEAEQAGAVRRNRREIPQQGTKGLAES